MHVKNVLPHYLLIVQLSIGMIKILIIKKLHFLLPYKKWCARIKHHPVLHFHLILKLDLKMWWLLMHRMGLVKRLCKDWWFLMNMLCLSQHLEQGFTPIVKKEIGSKKIKIVYRAKGTMQVPVPVAQQQAIMFD